MKQRSKQQMIDDIRNLILEYVYSAKSAHRAYLEAIRQRKELGLIEAYYDKRMESLDVAHELKKILNPSTNFNFWHVLFAVKKRRWTREEAATCSD